MRPELVYSLTEKGVQIAVEKNFLKRKVAFKESLWNIEPKLYGKEPNIPAWKKKFQKVF